MTILHLTGKITEDGKLVVELPEGLPSGDVELTLKVSEEEDPENRPWTEEELREAFVFTPKSGAEIIAAGLTGGWEDHGITDSAAWVEEVRRKQEERRRT